MMDLESFSLEAKLIEATELEKVRLLSYYFLINFEKTEFCLQEVNIWFADLHFAKPNSSRLKNKILKSPQFIRGNTNDYYKLHAREVNKLDKQFPKLRSKEEVYSLDSILPTTLYEVNRGYIESLGKQINSSFEHNIFDGCAVLMRRLIEILLILSYEKFGIANSIRNIDGNYELLEKIVNDATTNSVLGLSRNSKACLDKFRVLGNFSAHKVHYICKKQYIDEIIMEFRACIEELLYKAGLKI